MRDNACANLFQQFQESRDVPGPAWIAHAAATKLRFASADAGFATRFCHFHSAVSQHLAHGLVPEVLSDEIPFYCFRNVRISYRTSACVRDCSRAIAVTWTNVLFPLKLDHSKSRRECLRKRPPDLSVRRTMKSSTWSAL